MKVFSDDSGAGEMGGEESLGAYDLVEFYETTIPQDERGKWLVTKLRIIPDFLTAGPHVVIARRADTNEYLMRPMKSQRIIRVPASMIDTQHVGIRIAMNIAIVVAGITLLLGALWLEYRMNGHQDRNPDSVPVTPKNMKPKLPEQVPIQELDLDIDWKRRVIPK